MLPEVELVDLTQLEVTLLLYKWHFPGRTNFSLVELLFGCQYQKAHLTVLGLLKRNSPSEAPQLLELSCVLFNRINLPATTEPKSSSPLLTGPSGKYLIKLYVLRLTGIA